MELFEKIIIDWKPLIVFAKHSASVVWMGSEYALKRIKKNSFTEIVFASQIFPY